ncbi:MAG: hypothetical protein GY854_29500 [Deltaproteobacteria bacterium]|nr:hypothetical protein [Deltaproteobacteria bacterium]
MDAGRDHSEADRWTEFAQRLQLELAATTDISKRIAICHALARVLSEKLGKAVDAHQYLDKAIEQDMSSRDLGWDAWRAAGRRDPDQRIEALEILAGGFDRHEDAVAAKLWLAGLLKDHRGETELASAEIKEAFELLPEHRGVLLAQAEEAGMRNDTVALARSLEDLASLSEDPALSSAIYTEIADVERANVSGRAKVSELLAKALDESEADWAVVNDVAYLSADIGDWKLHERALEKMATAALETEPETGEEFNWPKGRFFEGFDRGESIAAAIWWQISLVRERRRRRPEEALDALEMARGLIPGHPFLEWERARLMEACERPADALDVIPDDASDNWKAQLALAADRPDMALALILSGRDSKDSLLAQVMTKVVGDTDESPPSPELDTRELLEWFQAHPRHPEAVRVAKQLGEAGVDFPAIRLAIWENTPPEGKWPNVISGDTDESWPLAVEAVLGSPDTSIEDRIQACLDWADRTADLTLEATFLSVAARFHEKDGEQPAAALDLYRRVMELDPASTDSSVQAVRLMHSEGKWTELVEKLAEDAAVTEDALLTLTAMHERAMILEHALDDQAEAAETVTDIISSDPEDVTAAWSAARLAFSIGNWQLVVQEMERLESLCSEDAAMFRLLCGEIHLFAIGNFDEALQCFEKAAQVQDETIAEAARFYSYFIFYQLNDLEALGTALKEQLQDSKEEARRMWLPEVFEIERATLGAREAADLLDNGEEQSPFKLVRQLMNGEEDAQAETTTKSLRQLAAIAPPGEMSGACLTAAALLNEGCPSAEEGFGEADLESREALWHTADRLTVDDDPMFRAEIFGEQAAVVEESDKLEWIDWMLLRAEAQGKAGDPAKALDTVKAALLRMSDHAGLLEARARFAAASGEWKDAADAHEHLAKYYVSEDEKAHHLAEAAHILFDKLDDNVSAQSICEEALRRVPGHPEAHEVYVRMLKKRGDEEAITTLLEKRIGVENDTAELVLLYEEKADQMLGADDSEGALEALDELLVIEPERLSAYLTKIEVLAGLERWPEAIMTMRDYITRVDDPVEVRITTWRATDLIIEELSDVDTALEWLEELVSQGDRHPDTLRRIASIARDSERWDTAAQALSQMSALIENLDRRIEIQREEAEVRLEQLFDDGHAGRIVDEILASRPADLSTLKFSLQFRTKEETQGALNRAITSVRAALQENPTDLRLVADLRELALLKDEKDLISLCDDVILLLSGGETEPWPGDLIPASDLDAEMQRRFFVHPDEANAASRVAEMASEIAHKAILECPHLPKIGRGTRVDSKKKNALKDWIQAWAKLLGYEKVEVHCVGEDPRGAVALPIKTPAVAVSQPVKSPLVAKHRFFLARNLWRSARGLAVFEEGDTSGPTRWVVAVTAAILGERIELPLSTDRDMVVRAKKAMPRRLRRGLTEPCNLLLKENRKSLRDWAQAISFSADRFGLLAATRLVKVIPLIVEESSGNIGLKKFTEDPGSTISKLPRCRELLRFALSADYLVARRQIGLKVLSEGDGK